MKLSIKILLGIAITLVATIILRFFAAYSFTVNTTYPAYIIRCHNFTGKASIFSFSEAKRGWVSIDRFMQDEKECSVAIGVNETQRAQNASLNTLEGSMEELKDAIDRLKSEIHSFSENKETEELMLKKYYK